MATISIRVSDDLKAKLEGLAHESGGTISGVVTEALGSMVGSHELGLSTGLAALWCDAACGAGGGRSVVDYRTTFINRAVSLPREGVAPCRSLRIVFAMTAS